MGINFDDNAAQIRNKCHQDCKEIVERASKGDGVDNSILDSKHEAKNAIGDLAAALANIEAEQYGIVDFNLLSDCKDIAKSAFTNKLGADFGTKELGMKQHVDENGKAAFAADDISLDNLMALLDDDVDMDKMKEYNEKPMLSQINTADPAEKLAEIGMDANDTDTIMNTAPESLVYMTNAIQSGKAKQYMVYGENAEALMDTGFDTAARMEAFSRAIEEFYGNA